MSMPTHKHMFMFGTFLCMGDMNSASSAASVAQLVEHTSRTCVVDSNPTEDSSLLCCLVLCCVVL